MSDEVMRAALATWAAKDFPARLLAGQVAKILNCTPDDVAILASAGKLRALGKPRPNAVKFFSSIELIALLADPDWLDEGRGEVVRRRRIKLPSYFWRFATLITLTAEIANEPGVDRLWTARTDCGSYPDSGSTLTTRYTYFSYVRRHTAE